MFTFILDKHRTLNYFTLTSGGIIKIVNFEIGLSRNTRAIQLLQRGSPRGTPRDVNSKGCGIKADCNLFSTN